MATNEGVEASKISCSHSIVAAMKENRTIYEWPGGIVLDMPADATAYDYEIVIKQVEVIGMRFNTPSSTGPGKPLK